MVKRKKNDDKCKICKETVEFISLTRGYEDTCCKQHKSTLASKRRKNTCLKKYGVENAAQNKNVKNKIKNTFIENYGVDHPFKNEEIKEKTRKTNL